MSYITTYGLMENQKTNMEFRLLIDIIYQTEPSLCLRIELHAF